MSEPTASLDKLKSTYPHDVQMSDGSSANLRILGRDDKDAIVGFARSLPDDDLLFLRVDITEPSVVENWISNVEAGFLKAFDAARKRIHEVAEEVYARDSDRSYAYSLGAEDF